MKSLETREMKELLVKCWMTHDGLWFHHSVQECGIEKTSRINQQAARGIGSIEARRIKKAFGIEKIETFEQLSEVLRDGFELVKGDFMHFVYDYSRHNIIHIETDRCFAHDGIKRIGAIDGYDCGIFARMGGWFDGLEIPYEITPPIEGCMMHTEGKCARDFKFGF